MKAQKRRKKKRPSAAMRNAGREKMNRPVKLSAELAEVVGSPALSRPETVKRLWAFCKKAKLLNPKDNREILCDARLKKLLGTSRTKLFGLHKLLAPHFDFSAELDSAEDTGEDEDLDEEGEEEEEGEEAPAEDKAFESDTMQSEEFAQKLALDPSEWSPREVQLWCQSIHVPVLAQKAVEYGVDGPTLLSFTEEDLRGIGVSTPFIMRRVLSELRNLGGG